MEISYENNTPKTTCIHCGAVVELVSLIICGTGLHCPHCFDVSDGSGHVGYVGDLCGTGVEECHLVRL